MGQKYQEKKEPMGPRGVGGGREGAVATTEKGEMEGADKTARRQNRKSTTRRKEQVEEGRGRGREGEGPGRYCDQTYY